MPGGRGGLRLARARLGGLASALVAAGVPAPLPLRGRTTRPWDATGVGTGTVVGGLGGAMAGRITGGAAIGLVAVNKAAAAAAFAATVAAAVAAADAAALSRAVTRTAKAPRPPKVVDDVTGRDSAELGPSSLVLSTSISHVRTQ